MKSEVGAKKIMVSDKINLQLPLEGKVGKNGKKMVQHGE